MDIFDAIHSRHSRRESAPQTTRPRHHSKPSLPEAKEIVRRRQREGFFNSLLLCSQSIILCIGFRSG